MPFPIADLKAAMSEQQYSSAIKIILSNPHIDLVNIVDENSYSLFMNVLELQNKPVDLIRVILRDPKFNFEYKNPSTNQTNVDLLISAARADIFEIALEDSRFLFNGDKLTYQLVVRKLQITQSAVERDSNKNPVPPSLERNKVRVENYKKIVPMLRDATILHAIKTDNPDLLQRMVNAGDKMNVRLSNGELPAHCLTAKNTKVRAWFNEQLKAVARDSSTSTTSFFQSESEIQMQIEAAQRQHMQQQIAIQAQAADRIAAAVSSLGNGFK